MDGSARDALVSEILADPAAEQPLADLAQLAVTSPAEAADLLEQLASSTSDQRPELASRWLREAATLWSGSAADPKRAARALRVAVELSPDDDEIAAQLAKLYRDNGKHRALARILERRAEALLALAGENPAVLARAAEAFVALGHLLRDPPLESPSESIAAYNRALETGAAGVETLRAARTLYVAVQQVADTLPLTATQQRTRASLPEHRLALVREEAQARSLGGDGAGATDVLRLAHRMDPSAGLGEEVARSILERLDEGEVVPATECVEAAELFVTLASRHDREELWTCAERTFAAGKRWEDASWAAERRRDWGRALALLGNVEAAGPDDKLRLALREAHLIADGLRDEKRAAARYDALLAEVSGGSDPARVARFLDLVNRGVLGAERFGIGDPTDIAARLEASALRGPDHVALRIAFSLRESSLFGEARAEELMRQTELLIGLGADRILAVRHAERGLVPLEPEKAMPILDRLAVIAGREEVLALHERYFDAFLARRWDEPSTLALERIVMERDRKRPDRALQGLFAAALARAEPATEDEGRTKSALLRRASRLARRSGDADLAWLWLGDALFARLEGSLARHTQETHRLEAITRELSALAQKVSHPPPPPSVSGLRVPAPPPPPKISSRPPPPRPAGDDLLAALFEAMHGLEFCKDAPDAAAFVLRLCMSKLGCAAGLAHLYDIDRREFVIVRSAGLAESALRGLRAADGEPLIAEAMRTRGALILDRGTSDPRASGRRWEILRLAAPAPITAIACARATQGGRFLGLIELASVSHAFASGDENALAYIAERFTDIVAARGITFGGEG